MTASATYSGAGASSFRIDRTVSSASPTYGDEVTVRINVQRTSWGDLLDGVRSDVPSCFERVIGTTRGQASGGSLISESNNEFSFSGNRANWNGPGVGPWFWMESSYRVLCDAGNIPTGGAEFRNVWGSYRGSMSLGPTITVQRKATLTSITQPEPVVVGQPTALNATTDAHDGTTVEFLVDRSVVGSAPASEGVAAFNWTAKAPGFYEIQARALETNTHASSSSSVVSAEVVKSSSTVSVSAASPAMAGSIVPLTATTTGIADGQPVEFLVDGQSLGTADVDNGTATYTSWTPATAGDYTVQARYASSATVAGSQSQQVGVTVIDPIQQTFTTLDVDPTPVPGQVSTLTATVENGNDGDSVEFSNHGTEIGTGTIEDGVATFSWTPPVGQAAMPYILMATYLGSDGYAASTSAPVTGTVGLVQTSASVVSAPATATVGEPVTLRATVTGGTTGETIEFRNGESVLTSVTLPSSGNASANWIPTETGVYNVTAHYQGTDTTNPASSPTATTVSVQASESTIDLVAPSPGTVGQATTLTARTTGIPDGQSLSFTVNGTVVDSAQVTAGQASIQWTPTAAGEYEVQAVYVGTDDVGPSQSETVVVVVTNVETTTSAVTASSNPVTGAAVTLTATVIDGTEGANVEFRDGTTVLCTAQVGADGIATCSWIPEEIGGVAVTAHYLGDDTTLASDSPDATTVDVRQGAVTPPGRLEVTPANPDAGQTVTVSGTAPAGSTVEVFTAGYTRQCSATTTVDGTFTCELGPLPVGTNTISAVATLNDVPSQIVSATVTIAQVTPTLTLTGPASVKPGQDAELTLTTTGIPDGETAGILVDDSVVGQATINGDAATYTWNPTTAGTYTIRASYGGSDSVADEVSNELTITVDALSSSTSRVSATPTSVPVGGTVTLAATITDGTEGVDVEFRNGEEVLCSDAIGADGTASCEWDTDAVGTFNVVAHYLGEAGVNNPSHSAQPTKIEVGKTASTVALTATSPVEVNGTVTFELKTTGIADGQTVDIKVGGAVVASPAISDGKATATWTAPAAPATLTAVAQYAGNATVGESTSEPVSIEVGKAPSTISTVDAASQATASQPATLSATVTGGTVGADVEFRYGTEVLCTSQVAADGTVVCPWTPSASGTVQVTAHYLGDATTNASDSASATTITVVEAPDTEAPAAPTGITVSPQPVTVGETVTVTGSAEAGSTVSVMVDGVEVCQATATGGTFECSFVATEGMDGRQVTVTATDAADNTSDAGNGGTLQVDPAVVDPTEPTITVTPAQPVAGQKVEIEITGDAGEEVVIISGDREICRVTLDEDGTATCEWTPAAEGQTVLKATVGDQTVEKTVTVRPAGGGGGDDNGSGSLDSGSLGSLVGGTGGTSGSLGSLSSLGG
ncbi:hypothetical protein GCM10022294_26760 [Dietzia aurantiaca]